MKRVAAAAIAETGEFMGTGMTLSQGFSSIHNVEQFHAEVFRPEVELEIMNETGCRCVSIGWLQDSPQGNSGRE